MFSVFFDNLDTYEMTLGIWPLKEGGEFVTRAAEMRFMKKTLKYTSFDHKTSWCMFLTKLKHNQFWEKHKKSL
jgi:hypothetical protein